MIFTFFLFLCLFFAMHHLFCKLFVFVFKLLCHVQLKDYHFELICLYFLCSYCLRFCLLFLLFTYNSISLIDFPFSFLLSTSLIKLCPNVWQVCEKSHLTIKCLFHCTFVIVIGVQFLLSFQAVCIFFTLIFVSR